MKVGFTFIFLFLFCLSASISAQNNSEDKKNKISVYSTFLGGNDVFQFEDVDGGGSYDSRSIFNIGGSYTYRLSRMLGLEAGLEYSKLNYKYTPEFFGEPIPITRKGGNIGLFSVPVALNVYFGKYIFVNTGAIFDFQIKDNDYVDKQTGVGAILGIGAKYDFDSGFSVFVNPYYKMHALIPFSSEKYHQRVGEYGLKIGASYSF